MPQYRHDVLDREGITVVLLAEPITFSGFRPSCSTSSIDSPSTTSAPGSSAQHAAERVGMDRVRGRTYKRVPHGLPARPSARRLAAPQRRCTPRSCSRCHPSSTRLRCPSCASSSSRSGTVTTVARRSAARITLPDGLFVAGPRGRRVPGLPGRAGHSSTHRLRPESDRGPRCRARALRADQPGHCRTAAALASVLLIWRLVDRQPISALGLQAHRALPRVVKGARSRRR